MSTSPRIDTAACDGDGCQQRHHAPDPPAYWGSDGVKVFCIACCIKLGLTSRVGDR